MESPKQASHPFHRPWKARKGGGLPTFPQLRRLIPIYQGRLSKAGLTAEPKTVTPEGGPKQTAEVGQKQLPKALQKYLHLAEFMISLATGSIVLLIGSSFLHGRDGRLPGFYTTPLLILAGSVLTAILFMVAISGGVAKPLSTAA